MAEGGTGMSIQSVSDPVDLKRSRRKAGDKRAVTIDRLPPHAPEAEMGVLGCQLLVPTLIGEVVEKFGNKAGEFHYDLRHQTIQETLVTMFDSRLPVDLITVQQHLKDRQFLDQIGGIAYLSQLQDAVPSAANLSYYLEIVREKYLLRKLIATCSGVVGKVYDYEGEVEVLLDEVEKEIHDVNKIRNQGPLGDMSSLVNQGITIIEGMFQRQGKISGLETGFADLDKMTDGLHGGEMIIVAARPSMGKTSLAMNIAEHVAVEQQRPVGVFSMEMSAVSLTVRMQCSMARVNLKRIQDGQMNESDFQKLTVASSKLSTSPLHIDDTAALSILELRARARRMHQQFKIELFIVDYLQLANAAGRGRDSNRQQEIADISGGLKALAKELNVPVIVLSQLNRELEKDKKRKPRLADLRESGAIEQDADIVGMLYKPSGDDDEADVEFDGVAVNFLIAKSRNGPTGDVHLTFLKPYTRFEMATRFSDADVPPQTHWQQ